MGVQILLYIDTVKGCNPPPFRTCYPLNETDIILGGSITVLVLISCWRSISQIFIRKSFVTFDSYSN